MSTPHWKLRRLASRALRVQARKASESKAIEQYGSSLSPKANAFIAAYDAAVRYEAIRSKEMAEGKQSIAGLVSTMRSWLPLLVRDIPGFDPSSFGDNPGVPDDVLADADRLEVTVTEFRDGEGNPLPYAEDLASELDIEGAAKEWEEAEAADSQYQKLLAEVRSTCSAFDAELQLFRKTLLAVFGRNDKDFQKLRVSKASSSDEEDDPSAPPPPTPVEPAPPGTSTP